MKYYSEMFNFGNTLGLLRTVSVPTLAVVAHFSGVMLKDGAKRALPE